MGVNWEAVWDVLKWVLAALVAGFIGQFGRSYAVHLMRRRRARRDANRAEQDELAQPPEPATAQLPPEVLIERERLTAETEIQAAKAEARATEAKIEKKRAKAELKRQKKARDDRSDDG